MILGIFFSSSFVFGQFNTIKPTIPKKSDSEISIDPKKLDKAETQIESKEKKSLKKILGITTKADLKNQIDSLKILIKESSLSNNQKWHLKKVQDSIIALSKEMLINNYQKSKNNDTQYDEKVPYGDLGAFMPLKNKLSVTSPYGMRTHPISGTLKFHNGIDLAAHYENVYCVMDGIVTETGWDNKGGGNYIKINHFGRFETAYLHLSEIYYHTGESVKAGFIIAKSGNTGNSTGPHLHFSVKEFGTNINPTHFLNDLIKVNHLIATYYAK